VSDERIGFKERFVAWLWNHPFKRLRNAHDPVVAAVLWSLAAAALVAAVLSPILGYSLADTVPVLGGVVVMLGSYFAARTLRDNELGQATQMLSSESEAVRLAGIYRLGLVGAGVPRFRVYVLTALSGVVAGDPGERSKQFAADVFSELHDLDPEKIYELRAKPAWT
jgi:hypothetical protein